MDLRLTFHIEPADRSVGIVAEGFSAWDNAPTATSWCDCENISPASFQWRDKESDDKCEPPANRALVEDMLRSFIHAYYNRDDADDADAKPVVKTHLTRAQQSAASSAGCTCHHDCGKDSASGQWHQHEDEPCPVHPDAQMVG